MEGELRARDDTKNSKIHLISKIRHLIRFHCEGVNHMLLNVIAVLMYRMG